jgi:D-glycerate 3-kinase
VYQWRSLQEQKLRDSTMQIEAGKDEGCRVMNEEQLAYFIQHFERISHHTLHKLPQSADVIVPVAADYSLTGIRFNSA